MRVERTIGLQRYRGRNVVQRAVREQARHRPWLDDEFHFVARVHARDVRLPVVVDLEPRIAEQVGRFLVRNHLHAVNHRRIEKAAGAQVVVVVELASCRTPACCWPGWACRSNC